MDSHSFITQNYNIAETESLVSGLQFDCFVPASYILEGKQKDFENRFLTKRKLIFCYRAIESCLKKLANREYTQFDALTTTTCCHGISLLTHQLLFKVSSCDLEELLFEAKVKIKQLEDISISDKEKIECSWFLPESLIELVRLHLLSVIKELDETRFWKSIVRKINEIFPIGTSLCTDLVSDLQHYFSNKIAERYHQLYEEIDFPMILNDVPLEAWAKYVKPEFIRVDRRGRKYAPSLFSIQICLAHLIHKRAKVALIHDLLCKEGKQKGKQVFLFEGDGESKLVPIEHNSHLDDEPVVVFGSCSYSDSLDNKNFKFKIDPWRKQITKLILANELFYPHYPRVGNDPDFDSTPIEPEEPILKGIFEKLSKVSGVSAKDPSFCCITHIYTASMEEVLKRTDQLPPSFVTEVARKGK